VEDTSAARIRVGFDHQHERRAPRTELVLAYISTAMTAGVNTAWLEAQTGVRYETLKRDYGKWLRAEGADQLEKLARLAPSWPPSSGDARNVVISLN